MKNKKYILKDIESLVKNHSLGESSGHDWWHTHRVRQMSLHIGGIEKADLFIVEAAALLHDIEDYKFTGANTKEEGSTVRRLISQSGVGQADGKKILEIVANISYMKSLQKKDNDAAEIQSVEYKVVSDSDRLDAMGAIGIARTFAFGGHFRREIHNPTILPNKNMTIDEYRKNQSTSINHFYEKLFKLKDTMLTETGKEMAQARHIYMESYLTRFFDEWNGEE